MRNLKTVSVKESKVPGSLPLSATAWDADGSIICAFGPTPTHPLIELKRKDCNSSEFQTVTSWDAPCPLPELDCDEILLLQHFSDLATSCLVLAGGDIVVVRQNPTPDQERIEIVGSVDVGILAAAWAPDEELLAIVTRSDTLVLMSRNFEPVTETTLTEDDLKASKHVSVGWGKKETQFQGKRAKAMRDPTMPETVDEGKPSPNEDGKITLSWRGDGAFFAVNSVLASTRRVIRVFSREAVLDSASEPVDGLESALSWRPAGNLIAGFKRSADKVEIIFFERNGLRHGEFELRLSKEDTETWASRISLSWNEDSTILAVVFLDRIQLWTMGNYHYYLKQEVCLDADVSSKLPTVRWRAKQPLRLCVSNTQQLLDLEYLFSVTKGSTIPPYDYGIVAVIDGRNLKLTPLKHAGVPPPMSFCEVQMDHNIVDCAVSYNGERLAVLTTASVEILEWPMRINTGLKNRHTTSLNKRSITLPAVENLRSVQRYTQVAFRGSDEVFILSPSRANNPSQLQRLSLSRTPITFHECQIDPQAVALFTDVRQESIWISDQKDLVKMEDEFGDLLASDIYLNGSYSDTEIFKLASDSTSLTNGYHENTYHGVTLSSTGILQVDSTVLARDCTSFAITHAHLLFTTSAHLLKFVHLTNPTQMEGPGNTPEVDERCRSIERGAKIVTVIPSIYAVVLQMPRGNLETIYPRVLVLSGIRNHIQQLDYRSAFLACQNQQVDMNILHDYQPEVFISNVSRFIEQLKKPSRIDEFLSKLKDEDVTQTLYRDTLNTTVNVEEVSAKQNQPSKPPQPDGKVNRICEAFLSALSNKTSTHLQNLITAHVAKRPPDLSAALSLIATLRQSSEEEADMAVSHLCFLTDTNKLYDVALALYDLEVTLLVAQNAQRDPREYMPFLQSLQALPVLRRKYTIDNHLRNFSKALESLHALEAHGEVEAYTTKHTLYIHAQQLYRYDQPRLNHITKLYADYLATQSERLSAAILYESLSDYTSAYPLYALAHKWREALSCAYMIPLDPDQLRPLAISLATTCADESRDYRSAATIHAEYLHDHITAAQLLCKGSYFAEATRLLTLHSLSSELPRIIDTGLSDKFSEILELVADCKSQLGAQIPRIKELRQKKEEDPLAFYGGDTSLMNAADGVDIPDNVSLAATDASTVGGQSLFTRYGSNASKFGGTVASNVSRKTSKTKRREERKRARGKKGSVYEEEYLVASVARLIERVNGVHEEVARLVGGLLRRAMREQAGKVEKVMGEIVVLCEKANGEVWPVKAETGVGETGDYDVNGEGRPKGGDGVLWDNQVEMGQKKEAPVVKSWTKNKLVS